MTKPPREVTRAQRPRPFIAPRPNPTLMRALGLVNRVSMLKGDNWIGDMVSAIMNGPDWSSTAIFITYDECGCFYDHVPPPPGRGLRIPMVNPRYRDFAELTVSVTLVRSVKGGATPEPNTSLG